jgi:cytochrome c peroxidase
MRRLGVGLGAFTQGLALVATFACSEPSKTSAPEPTSPERRPERSLGREPLEALPAPVTLDSRMVALGRRLFHDKRLSADDSIACASCHDLANGGDDGRVHSVGVKGQEGGINAPSVYNAALNFVQFWDGRAKTLEDQADGPVTNPVEMGARWDQVLPKLERDARYQTEFAALFSDGITSLNARRAIADFERTLVTRGSPFDRYLGGDQAALSPEAKSGYETFKSVGCIACHQGANVGGNMFQRFGVLGDYFKDRGRVTEADYGRFNVTKNEADRFVFRVPSLRNVENTAPYFHDGSAPTLTVAVQTMAKYQLGRHLADEQVSSIVAFLKSLSGPTAETAP